MRLLNILHKFSAKAEVVTIGSRVRDLFFKHKIPFQYTLKKPLSDESTQIHKDFNEIAVAHGRMLSESF